MSMWVPGRSPGTGSGDERGIGGMANEVPKKLTTFLGLKVYFCAKYVNNFIPGILTKFGLLIFSFWTPHFVVWTEWTPHFG